MVSWSSARTAPITSSAPASSDSASRLNGSGWSDENSSASSADLRFCGGIGSSPFGRPGDDRDLAERFGLHHRDQAELHQLEQRDERHDHFGADMATEQEGRKRLWSLLGGQSCDEGHLVVDVVLLGLDV